MISRGVLLFTLTAVKKCSSFGVLVLFIERKCKQFKLLYVINESGLLLVYVTSGQASTIYFYIETRHVVLITPTPPPPTLVIRHTFVMSSTTLIIHR